MCLNCSTFSVSAEDNSIHKGDKRVRESDVNFKAHDSEANTRQSTERTEINVQGNNNTVINVASGGTVNFSPKITIGMFIIFTLIQRIKSE